MTADEMFKKLGFEKYEYKEYPFVSYIKEMDKPQSLCIDFYLDKKEYGAHYEFDARDRIAAHVNMKENKAIQMKLKELGWLE